VTDPRVLVLHNRYRVEGGEERAVSLHLDALANAGIAHELFERRSADVGPAGAAAALVRGGARTDQIATAVQEMRATVAHAHNTLPLIGARGLAAAREAGAKVALTLHNVRLFCATGLGERDGGPCTRCRGRNSLPGLVLNCRRSLPQALAYATALSVHHPTVLASVDRFVTPSAWAADRVAFLGLPRDRVEVVPHALPADAFAERSRAHEGAYALVLSRLSPEKGVDDAISPGEAQDLLRGAAAVLVPSHCHEFSPYSALEAMAQGVPVVATAMGGLPELIGAGGCVALHDEDAFAARLAALWTDPRRREAEGAQLIARARANHSEERFTRDLLRLYREL
jgi:glycosyltransferase involved in cell wall biosynthesis